MTSVFSTRASRSHLLWALIPFFSFSVYAQSRIADHRVTAVTNQQDGTVTLQSEIPLSELEAILVTDMHGKVVHGYSLERDDRTLCLHLDENPAGNYMVHLLYREWDEQIQISKY
jgi:hypothetical protein